MKKNYKRINILIIILIITKNIFCVEKEKESPKINILKKLATIGFGLVAGLTAGFITYKYLINNYYELNNTHNGIILLTFAIGGTSCYWLLKLILKEKREELQKIDPKPEELQKIDPKPEELQKIDPKPEELQKIDPKPEDHKYEEPKEIDFSEQNKEIIKERLLLYSIKMKLKHSIYFYIIVLIKKNSTKGINNIIEELEEEEKIEIKELWKINDLINYIENSNELLYKKIYNKKSINIIEKIKLIFNYIASYKEEEYSEIA
jgi:hypothetical protein